MRRVRTLGLTTMGGRNWGRADTMTIGMCRGRRFGRYRGRGRRARSARLLKLTEKLITHPTDSRTGRHSQHPRYPAPPQSLETVTFADQAKSFDHPSGLADLDVGGRAAGLQQSLTRASASVQTRPGKRKGGKGFWMLAARDRMLSEVGGHIAPFGCHSPWQHPTA